MRGSWTRRRPLESPDVHGAVDDPREAGTALVGGQGVLVGQGIAARVDGRAAGQERDGLRRPSVVRQQAQPGIRGPDDQVALGAIGQAAGLVDADQVVRTDRGNPGMPAMSSGFASWRTGRVLTATIVLYKVVVLPGSSYTPPPMR